MVLKSLRNYFALLVAKAVEEKIDGREITKKIDAELDKRMGEVGSEKIQRGPLSNLLMEMLEGLWEEEPAALILYLERWAERLLKRTKKEGRK